MKRLDRITLVFLVLSGIWVLAQFVLAFFVHVTQRAQLTSKGWVVPPTKTYIQAFAVSEVALTVVALGVVVLVSTLLVRRIGRGEFGAGRLAWGVSIATMCFGVVGFRYLFGVGVLLCVACASVRRHLPAKVPGSNVVRDVALG